jgi:hypothetical protein
VLGQQFNRVAVCNRVALREIPHGLYKQTLAIHVAGIRRAFAPSATDVGWDGYGEDLGHEFPIRAQVRKNLDDASEYTAAFAITNKNLPEKKL